MLESRRRLINVMYYVPIAIAELSSKKEGGLGEAKDLKTLARTGVIEAMLPTVLQVLFCESRCLLFGCRVESKAAEWADCNFVLFPSALILPMSTK